MGIRRRGEASVLAALRQEGSLKVRFPRPGDAVCAEAVLLNIGGGVAAGDALSVSVSVAEGARAIVAGQAAERFYRAADGNPAARVRTALFVAADGALEWLPQEAILFDGSALDRTLTVEIEEGASFLGVEALVFGRRARGEVLRRAWLRDRIVLRRAGRLVLHDTLRIEGDAAGLLSRRAVAGGAGAAGMIVATLPADLDGLRAALAVEGVEVGASAWDGIVLARLVARDGACLRAAVLAGFSVLRGGRPMPRVWAC
jgi:urease accessory protein